jgi:demethylmenaquinone methyltransferase/2-methoxy-6-polyprenyl-1,4-benzoquinol methylase
MASHDDPRSQPVAPHPTLEPYYGTADNRRAWVDRIFDTTARHYDWINRVMSFGSGIWYRREALRRAGVGPGAVILDVCIGSGQVARPALELVGDSGHVVGLDASIGMLMEAQRAVPAPLMQGYVERLPVASASVDFVTMGYALRHVADLHTTFSEYLRVLRPGGTLLILELTRPRRRAMYALVRFYLQSVVPTIARLGGRDARILMRYFWDTIDNCVPPEKILDALDHSDFETPERYVLFDLFSEYRAHKRTDA